MKLSVLLLVLLSLFISTYTYAGNSKVFTYDYDKVEQTLSPLKSLESLITDKNISYKELREMENPLFSILNYNQNNGFGINSLEPPLGIPSYLWGACGSFWGILLVYLITEDKEETKKAAYGFIGATAIAIGCTVIYSIVIVGTQFAILGGSVFL
jgi:hypothetical protein